MPRPLSFFAVLAPVALASLVACAERTATEQSTAPAASEQPPPVPANLAVASASAQQAPVRMHKMMDFRRPMLARPPSSAVEAPVASAAPSASASAK